MNRGDISFALLCEKLHIIQLDGNSTSERLLSLDPTWIQHNDQLHEEDVTNEVKKGVASGLAFEVIQRQVGK